MSPKSEKLEPGIYSLVCLKATTKHAKTSGHEYISLECKVEGHQAKVWEIIMREGKGKTLGELKIAGWGFKPGSNPSPSDFIDRRAQAHLAYEDWDGEPWLKVKAFATTTGGYVPPSELQGSEPPHKAAHKNPDKPAGRPRKHPVDEGDMWSDEDSAPF